MLVHSLHGVYSRHSSVDETRHHSTKVTTVEKAIAIGFSAQRRLRFFDVWWQSDAEADVSVDRNVASVLGDGRVAYT